MSNYSEQFLKQNPLAVLGILRDLQKKPGADPPLLGRLAVYQPYS
ncbi:Inner membrane protein [Cronobacter sakazakii 680]|nr:Inner membrane protein [Cronobacter sakazakii 680]